MSYDSNSSTHIDIYTNSTGTKYICRSNGIGGYSKYVKKDLIV